MSRLPKPILMTIALAPALGSLWACRSYERRPLELDAAADTFLARDAGVVESALAGGVDAGGAGPFSLKDGVTLREAEAVAMVYNAELRLARLDAGVTSVSAEHAGAWEDPVLGVDLARIVENVEHPWEVGVTVGLTIPVSGRLELEKQRAGLEHAAEVARVAQREWETRCELRRAWARWSALRAGMDEGRGYVDALGGVVAIVDVMEHSGEIAVDRAEGIRADASLRAAELDLLQAEAEEEVVLIHRLMGVAPGAALALVPELGGGEAGATLGFPGGAQGDAWRRLAESSPLLAVVLAEYEVAEKALELAVREQYPDIEIGPGYGREDGDDRVLLGVSVPLPVLGGAERAIAIAQARREAARGRAHAAVEALLSELAQAQVRLASATRHRVALEGRIVPMVESLYERTRSAQALGETTAVEAIGVLERRHETRVRLIDARRAEAVAAIRVTELTGPGRVGAGPDAPDADALEKGVLP